MIDDDGLEMSDDAILRAADEAEEEDAWIILCAELQVAVDESPQRAAAVVHVARQIPSLAHADGLDPWDPDRLDRWMLSDELCSTSGYWAAMLVLALWKGTAASSFTGGDLIEALTAADHRALQRLAASPAQSFLPERIG